MTFKENTAILIQLSKIWYSIGKGPETQDETSLGPVQNLKKR